MTVIMPKPPTRTCQLQQNEVRALVSRDFPGRINLIRRFVNDKNPSYELRIAAGVFARAFAGFFGIGLRKGRLCRSSEYYEHIRGESSEVKVSDVDGGALVDPRSLPDADQRSLQEGLNEVNLAFAHQTFWSSTTHQTVAALPTPEYEEAHLAKIRALCRVVCSLYDQRSRIHPPNAAQPPASAVSVASPIDPAV